MVFIYNLGISGYFFLIRIFAFLGNKKAKLWIEGRKNVFEILKNKALQQSSDIAWFHCASLGEFEQGKPVIERFKKEFPDYLIYISFFSPSGYEVRKDYAQADCIFYLPLDTAQNAKKLLGIIKPKVVVFVKYEFWYHYLNEIQKQKITLLLVSANFRASQMFFKNYGQLFRRILKGFTHIFVQNQKSFDLLESVGIKNVTIAGDTRFDRVSILASDKKELPLIEQFKSNEKLLIIGSCWDADLEILIPFLNKLDKNLHVIIAPHEIHQEKIQKISKRLNKESILYSELKENNELFLNQPILIIDNVGILAQSYFYADFAYIGGAFGEGLHNILEPASFGIPVFFGKDYKDFPEAQELIERGGAFSVKTSEELSEKFSLLANNEEGLKMIRQANLKYIEENKGGTEKIIHCYQTNFA